VPGDSRDRMVRSAASLMASRGMTATSLSEVLADSGSPRGSIYHHFPDGKRELAKDAVRLVAQHVLESQRACAATSGQEVLDHFISLWRRVVVASNGAAGCAIAGAALDCPPDDVELIALVRISFQSWIDLLQEQLTETGQPPERAEPIAWVTVAALEGALILCRAQHGPGPLDKVAAELSRLLT
jgi:TetR/AcrR family transcriptional regulator, lmrAB and yxaGH operons repressor